jgi:hypothetical protein
MSYLFVAIEPLRHETRLLVSVPLKGTALKARLPAAPKDGRALAMLLEALVAWYGLPLCAVLDADAEDVQRHPDLWGRILGDLQSPQTEVEWVSPSEMSETDRSLTDPELGDFRSARHLITLAGTGQR